MVNNANPLHTLCDNIGPNDLGIIWLTESGLNDQLNNFFEMNYLMDGLLSQSTIKNDTEFNFFLTQQFGEQFFLIHKEYQPKHDFNKLQNILKVSQNKETSKNNVILLVQSEKIDQAALSSKLSKQLKTLTFSTLNL